MRSLRGRFCAKSLIGSCLIDPDMSTGQKCSIKNSWSIETIYSPMRSVNSSTLSDLHFGTITSSHVACAGTHSARKWTLTRGSTTWASNNSQSTWTSYSYGTIRTRSALAFSHNCHALASGKASASPEKKASPKSWSPLPLRKESSRSYRPIIFSAQSAWRTTPKGKSCLRCLASTNSTLIASRSGSKLKTGALSAERRSNLTKTTKMVFDMIGGCVPQTCKPVWFLSSFASCFSLIIN